MPASQHQNPKSDIEIAQAAKMTPICRCRATSVLASTAEISNPMGITKRRCRWISSSRCRNRPNGKLVLVSAITPTPAGEGKTTTTVG